MRRKHRDSAYFHLQKEKVEKNISWWKILVNYLLIIFAAVVLAYGFVTFLCQCIRMNDSSMEPLCHQRNVLLVDKISYKIREVKRGDVVAIERTENKNTMIVKRVVGLPGDTVAVVGGRLVINGKQTDASLSYSYIEREGRLTEPVTLDDDEYFVIGDSPSQSEDSRFVSFGDINKSEIKGRVFYAWVDHQGKKVTNGD